MAFSLNPLPPQILKKKKKKQKLSIRKLKEPRQPRLSSKHLPTEAKVLGAGISIQSLVVKTGAEYGTPKATSNPAQRDFLHRSTPNRARLCKKWCLLVL